MEYRLSLNIGGTKFVLGVGDENGNLYETISIPTETPETLKNIDNYFRTKDINALGVRCFDRLS